MYGISDELKSTLDAWEEADLAEAPDIPSTVRVDRWRWWTFKRLGDRATARG